MLPRVWAATEQAGGSAARSSCSEHSFICVFAQIAGEIVGIEAATIEEAFDLGIGRRNIARQLAQGKAIQVRAIGRAHLRALMGETPAPEEKEE